MPTRSGGVEDAGRSGAAISISRATPPCGGCAAAIAVSSARTCPRVAPATSAACSKGISATVAMTAAATTSATSTPDAAGARGSNTPHHPHRVRREMSHRLPGRIGFAKPRPGSSRLRSRSRRSLSNSRRAACQQRPFAATFPLSEWSRALGAWPCQRPVGATQVLPGVELGPPDRTRGSVPFRALEWCHAPCHPRCHP